MRLRVAPEARAAVQLAAEEASALGAPRMGSEHLLLGILRAGDAVGAAALRANGVTLEAARMAAQPTLANDEPAAEGAVTATRGACSARRCARPPPTRAT